ncbi:hypothetical protein F511_33911 [Dorcoceras hygrometricum]|uniref:Uncharacterized protein n=1 Tax=Dorcoceras hygrometricum TaxID=472368 RepID=A0A2Z7A1C1_9LAMI|nr:hypothetical protein F511_33911 [Dorcoceras hygrometricum]
MRELRVTSCWFGKTVEELERRRFVKMKRCVLEPAARGLSVVALEKKTSSDANPTAMQIQQQREIQQQRKFSSNAEFSSSAEFSSDADFIFSTKSKTSNKLSRESSGGSSVQATIQRVRDLERFRAIDLLPKLHKNEGQVEEEEQDLLWG